MQIRHPEQFAVCTECASSLTRVMTPHIHLLSTMARLDAGMAAAAELNSVSPGCSSLQPIACRCIVCFLCRRDELTPFHSPGRQLHGGQQ